jgi:hypothetical protein
MVWVQVQKSWIPSTVGTCLRNDITFYTLAAVTILFDIIILLLPIPVLLDLQINTRRKMALLVVFTLGIFTTFCSIMRMVQIGQIAKDGNSTMLVLWGTIEMNVGVSFIHSALVSHQCWLTCVKRSFSHVSQP